ncbi:MAG: 3-isopropylmalate/(R)-2-methylmalate dehydratase small subunit, partial [Pseudonocardiales bacterium]|nr:3-isopropylmalate/(R)-2-methylmalate dehydratase small subunit [Pseudonocardiales bacterium]
AGLLTVELAEKIVQRLWDDIETDPTTQVTVDLVERQVRWSGEVHDFELDDYTRWRLLEGFDDIGLTLRHTDAVTEYESTRNPWLPSVPA